MQANDGWWSSHKASVIHLSCQCCHVRFSGHSLFLRFSPAFCHLISYIRRVKKYLLSSVGKAQLAMQGENLRKGPWLQEEDERLTTFVGLLGERRWDSIARASGLKRSGKSCRLRWLNYLHPDLKRCQISPEEEQIILQLHKRWGNKWSWIARSLPGRTDNEIKNYWRTHLRKRTEIEEQDIFRSEINNAQQDFLIQNYATTKKSKYEDCGSVEDVSGATDDSFDTLALSNIGFLSSPYENRLSEWMSWQKDDLSESKHHVECNNLDLSFSYPTWISEDCDTGAWDGSGSLWVMD